MTDRWRLGRFEVISATREVLAEGKPLPVGARAFDLLMALVKRQGQVCSKDDLLAAAWPGLVVEENNLTVQISALRKWLGPEAVVTVPARGYQLGMAAEPASIVGSGAENATDPLPPSKPSIGVLPFANLSGDPHEEAFCDGITEDVITELARFRALFVISRNSSFTYKGRAVDVRKAGRELGVRYILEGSIRRAGQRVRVNAQLVEASSGVSVWAEKYDRVLTDIFELQGELTRSIVASIAPQIELTERARVRPRPNNFDAYDLALRAWATLRTLSVGGEPDAARRERARQLAREALALDPASPLAMRTLAWAQFTELWLSSSVANIRGAEEAIALAERVISADNGNHDAYHFKGLLQFMLGRHEAGLGDLRRAHELNPNDATTQGYLGFCESLSREAGRGMEHVRDALRRSPRDPQRYLLLSLMAWCCYAAAEFEEAIRYAQSSIADAPWFAGPWLSLAVSRAALGQLAPAAEAAAKVRELAPELLRARLAGQWLGGDPRYHQQATTLLRKAVGETGSR